QSNNFGTSAITFSGTLTNLRNLAISNTNTGAVLPSFTGLTNLRNLTLIYNNAAIALPAITLTNSGSLAITAGGAITQSGALIVPGTASFTAGTNAITLTNANNNMTGAVSLSNSGSNNATINNSTNLTLGASTVGQELIATSSAAIILNGNLSANATGNSIVLSGTQFNNSSGFSLNPGTNGRFLVWSSNPNPFGGSTPDNRGNLSFNFVQYNATYGVTSVLGSGNG